jgi:hypothetical protein
MLKRQTTEILDKSGSSEPPTTNPEKKMVEALAYQLWLQRGCPIGSEQEDWLEAERQLRGVESMAA